MVDFPASPSLGDEYAGWVWDGQGWVLKSLDLGNAAFRDVGTTAGTVAAGDDARLVVAEALDARLDAIEALGPLATDAEVAAAIAGLASVYQPADGDLAAIAGLATTAFGRGLLTLAGDAALRAAAGLGTAAVLNTGTGAGELPTKAQVDTLVSTAINALVAGSPGLLDTLDELAAALGDDANFAATVTAALAGKQPADDDLAAIAALTTTAFGRGFLTLVDAAAGRSLLALGTAATRNTPASGNASTTEVVLGTDTRLSDKRIGLAYVQATAPIGTIVDGERWLRTTDDTVLTRIDGLWVEYLPDTNTGVRDAVDLLSTEAVLWLDADLHDGGHKWRNAGTGGPALDATLGSSAVTGYGTYIGGGRLNLNGVSGNYAVVPHATALGVTGDIEIFGTWDGELPTQGGMGHIIGKAASNAGYRLAVRPDRLVDCTLGNGTGYTMGLSTVAVPVGSRGVGVSVDLTNGTNSVFTFWTTTDGTTWAQLGATVLAAPIPLVASINQVGIGAATSGLENLTGNLRRVWVRNVTTSTTVLDVDFSTQPDGTRAFRESSGNAVVTVVSTNWDTNDPEWLRAEPEGYALVGTSVSDKVVVTSGYPAITGDIDIAVRMAPMPGWVAGNIVGRYSIGSQSYFVGLNGTGRPTFNFSLDGTLAPLVTASADAPIVAGQWMWLRWTREAATGVCRFYSAADTGSSSILPGSWTQIGTDVTGIVGSLANFATGELAVLGMGGSAILAKYGRCVIRNGIGGTIAIDVSTALWTESTQATFTAATGQPGTISRASAGRKAIVVPGRNVSGRSRFLFGTDDYGEIPDHPLLDFGATDSFTVVWVGREWAAQVVNAVLVNKREGAAGWMLRHHSTTATAVQPVLSDAAAAIAPLAQTIPTGTLSLVGMVVDRAAQTVRSALAGALGSTTSIATVGDTSNTHAFRIGRHGGANTNYADMECLAVAVFRRALTATELALIANYYGAA